PSSAGRANCGAGLPISADGMSCVAPPAINCRMKIAASTRKIASGSSATTSRRLAATGLAASVIGGFPSPAPADALAFQFRQFSEATAMVDHHPDEQAGDDNGRDGVGRHDIGGVG